MAVRKKDGLTSIFELPLLELLIASPQPLTVALQPPPLAQSLPPNSAPSGFSAGP